MGDEYDNDMTQPRPQAGLPDNPMIEFFKWAAENKPLTNRDGEIEGDIPADLKILYYPTSNKNVKLSNMTEKEIKISRLRLTREMMFDKTFMPKKNMTPDMLSAMNKLPHDFLHTSSQSRNNEFMRNMMTVRSESFQRIRDDRQEPPQPRFM